MLLNSRHYNSVGVHAGPLNGANATEKAQEAVGGRSEDELRWNAKSVCRKNSKLGSVSGSVPAPEVENSDPDMTSRE